MLVVPCCEAPASVVPSGLAYLAPPLLPLCRCNNFLLSQSSLLSRNMRRKYPACSYISDLVLRTSIYTRTRYRQEEIAQGCDRVRSVFGAFNRFGRLAIPNNMFSEKTWSRASRKYNVRLLGHLFYGRVLKTEKTYPKLCFIPSMCFHVL